MGYKYFNDPGHGWVKVPAAEILGLGIADKISSYSYVSPSGKFAYLEEDRDMQVWWNAKRDRGDEWSVDSVNSKGPSSIRNYPHYSPPKLIA